MRRTAVLTLVGALVLAGVQPAAAASTPSATGMVSFTAASYSRAGSSAGLTVDWNSVRKAKKYQVFLSRHYSMSHAKKFTTSHTSKTFKGLARGASYFVQVRGVNGSKVGKKSKRVGHTTIREMAPANGPTYRVMTYNLCSDKCGGWSERSAAAEERITSYGPDVIAAQEANKWAAIVPGYSSAIYKSAKQLLYKTARFETPVTENPEPSYPPKVGSCADTYTNGRIGYVFLGFHGHPDLKDPKKDTRGCRYAVWAELVDKASGDRTIFVNAHAVAGDNTDRARERLTEIRTLTSQIDSINPDGLPVVYAGDFNSHKNRSNDYLRTAFHRLGYYDAYDLAQRLYRQHYNSYSGFGSKPRTSYKWGDHVDHVWIKPSQGRVLGWYNVARIRSGRMVAPIPSDHSPLLIDLRLN